jgi:hypothetical protein
LVWEYRGDGLMLIFVLFACPKLLMPVSLLKSMFLTYLIERCAGWMATGIGIGTA